MSTGSRLPQSLRPEAELSLPPQVTGHIQGESLLHISELKLTDGPHEGQTLQVQVQWWGDTGAGTLLQIGSSLGTAAARFPIRCSAKHFQRYLQDMEWLALALEDRSSGMLGEAALAVNELTEQRPLAGAISFVQWLKSGENKLVATAQLKLLLSFTPIQDPAKAAGQSVASEFGYHSSCSDSSQGSLSSNCKISEGTQHKPENAQETREGRGPSKVQPDYARRRPACRQPGQDHEGPHHEKQPHTPQPVQHSAADPTAMLASTLSYAPAASPKPADVALEDEMLCLTKQVAGPRWQGRPPLPTEGTAEGVAAGLSPHVALSRLIQRAEQLRQMLSATSADVWCSDQPLAQTDARHVQHDCTFSADTPVTAAIEQEPVRVALYSAVSGASSEQQHIQLSNTPATLGTATCESKSGSPRGGSAEQTQYSLSMSAASTPMKQKRASDRALPVSKLRTVAEGKSGILGRPLTLSPLHSQGPAAPPGLPRSGYSLKLYKDAACQTPAAAAPTTPHASRPSNSASHEGLSTANGALSPCQPRHGAQAQAAGRSKKPLRQLGHPHGDLFEPKGTQEGLVRAYSAPALSGATASLSSICEAVQPCAQIPRDACQHATPGMPATDMQHSRGLSSRRRGKLPRSSKLKTPSTADRQAWCNTFNPPRQRPAGQKARESSKRAASSPAPHKHSCEHHSMASTRTELGPDWHIDKAAEGKGMSQCPHVSDTTPMSHSDPVGAVWCISQEDDNMSPAPFLNLGDHVVSSAKPVQATVRMEVVQACGLLAAVNAAEQWSEGGSTLKRAKLHGPAAYACFSLSSSGSCKVARGLPSIMTAAQQPTFCPSFQAKQEHDVSLDSQNVRALALQEGWVEVWAAASPDQAPVLSSPRHAQHPPGDVLLGFGTFAVHDLLIKAQGIQRWVALTSQQGSAAGAVQLRAALLAVDGVPISTQLTARPPLQQVPGLQALLPPERPAHVLTGSTGFSGQPARATVQTHSACIPPVKASHRQTLKYSVMYRLPGDAALQLTPRVEAEARDAAAFAGKAQHVALNHTSAHWVMADERLAHRLLSTPMLATVLLHQRTKRGDPPPQPVPVGTAEVDMSSLLLPRLGTIYATRRTVSGSYPLIHPGSKSLHGACILIKVCLDLDPPDAQQALPELQRAAMPKQSTTTLAAPSLQDPGQDNVQGEAGRQTVLGPFSEGPWAKAEAPKQGCLRPTTAETSTEYFARMEACSAQPASAQGAASEVQGTMHELGSSPTGQLGRYGQLEDLLAAWRQLSDMDGIPHEPLAGDMIGDAHSSPQLDDELARVTHAQLAALFDPEQAPLQASHSEDLITGAYTSAAWDISGSPCMLMGSPDGHLQQELPYGQHASAWQPSHFPESPEQLLQYRTWSPELREAAENALQPFSSAPGQKPFLTGLAEQFPEQPPHTGSSQAEGAGEGSSCLGLQFGMEAGVSEHDVNQPSEEDLYRMLARFERNYSQLSAGRPATGADRAAMSPSFGQMQRAEHETAASPSKLEHDPVQVQNAEHCTASEQQEAAGMDHSSTADQESTLKAAMYMDTLEPNQAAHILFTESPLRLATCSDDEEIAVLDFGPGSDNTSEHSLGDEGIATHHNKFYSAPRGALIMPGTLEASGDWLFGLDTNLRVGHLVERPACALRGSTAPASRESSAEPREQDGFAFTNVLPPLSAHDDVMKQPHWIPEPSFPPQATCSAASPPDLEQATTLYPQADRDEEGSGNRPHASKVTEQPMPAGDAKLNEDSAQHDLDGDLSTIFLSSLSLCSPSAFEATPVTEAIQVLAPPAHGKEQHSASKEEVADVSLLNQKAAQPEQSAASGLFRNSLPQPDERFGIQSSSAALSSRADDRGQQQSDAQTAASTGISRREVFRQKLAAAQLAQLGAFDEPKAAGSSPEAALIVTQHVQKGSPSANGKQSEGCISLQKEPVGTVTVSAHDSMDESSGPAPATPRPAKSSCIATTANSQQRMTAESGPGAHMQDESSSSAGSEPEIVRPDLGGLPDEAADGSIAGVRWAENAAAGESVDEPEEASEYAIRRMSAVARKNGPAPAQGQSASQRSTAAAVACPSDELHGDDQEAHYARMTQISPSGSSSDSACGMARTANEAANVSDAAVRCAENAANADAAAGDGEERDEALLHAIRRMSVAVREHSLGGSPAAEFMRSTAGVVHAGSTNPTTVQQSTQEQDSRSATRMLPSLQHAAEMAVSPVTMRDQGTQQTGQDTLPNNLMWSMRAAGCVHTACRAHGSCAGQTPSSPARASYEQLLTRFRGSPVPEQCSTPPPGLAAHGNAEQHPGSEAGGSVRAEGAVMLSGQPFRQPGSPPWQRRSPLPICSPAHAYVAGQTLPAGTLGPRLQELEPRQVLPALRAMWGHDRKHPPGTKLASVVGPAEIESSCRSAASTQEVTSSPTEGKKVRDIDLTVAPHPPALLNSTSDAAGATAAHTKNSPHATLTVIRDTGGARRAGTLPAAKRGTSDPEAECIARIMASVRASPWQDSNKHSPQG